VHTYSIIPDNCKKFLAFAEQLPLAAEYKETLSKSKVTKIQVDIEKNSWQVYRCACTFAGGRIIDVRQKS
jgi:hypothetical protein